MCYFKEKSAFILFIFLISSIFIARPQFVYSQIEFDTDPPSVVQTSPGNGATAVPINSSIEVLFSEFMDTLFNPFSIVPSMDGQFEWELDQTLIFSPAMLLDYNETYQVTIGTEATDLSGNSLENPYQWSFVTELSPWLHFFNIQGLSLDQSTVKLILGDVNGDIWVVLSSSGGSDDLFVFNGFDQSDFVKVDEDLGQINAIKQDSAGNIWIASESDDPGKGGVHMFDGTDWTHYNTDTNTVFSDNSMKCLAVDSEDNIWVGSSYSGIYMSDDGTSWTNYNMTNSDLTNDWVTTIEADEDDYIWVATPFGGIEGFDPQTNTWTSFISTIENQFNISFPLINEIVAGPGGIWAATDLGLLKYDIASDQWELFTDIDRYSQMSSIAVDPSDDTLWVGTDQGLIKFDGTNGEPIIMDNAGPAVQEVSVDVYGNAWLGTSNSLSRYDSAPPILLSVSPSSNKKNVKRTTQIILTFSEPMNKDSIISALSISPAVSFTSSMNASSTKLTITPKSKLKDNKKYTVTLGKNATDKQGRPFTASTSWSFKTEKSTTTTGTTGIVPSTSWSFPSTGFRFPATGSWSFPSTGFTFPATGSWSFPSTGFRFPATVPSTGFRFPATGSWSFPSTGFNFPATGFRFPATGFTYTSSPFNIGGLVYPR
ncbi:MAG: Ig-like domain-containing protein [bacterium]